jgi:hypothetical protein
MQKKALHPNRLRALIKEAGGFLFHSVFKIQQRLTPFADNEAVRTLEKRVALLAERKE